MSYLGSGTYGNVQKDRDNPEIAIKTVHFANIHSAIREIVILKSLSHKNIIQIQRVNVDFKEFQINLSLERFDTNLEQFRLRHDKSFISKYLPISLKQIFSAVKYLHEQGVIHRDITPANILVKYSKDNERQKRKFRLALCDFGLAVKKFNNEQENFETAVCTVTYRAPEIYIGVSHLKYNEKVDVWSLGCLLYFLLAGEDLIDYETYLNLFPKKRQESSLYLSYFYGLPDYGNHLTRLKAMKRIPAEDFRQIYYNRLKNSDIDKSVIKTYLDLITDCLTVDCQIRPNIHKLLEKYPYLNQPSIVTTPKKDSVIKQVTQANPGEDNDKFSVLTSVDLSKYILPKNYQLNNVNTQPLIEIAKKSGVYEIGISIYNRFLSISQSLRQQNEQNQNNNYNTELFYIGAFYIACLLLEAKNDSLFEEYMLTLCSPVEFSYVLITIMDALSWDAETKKMI